jgi:hypothetical protein
MAKQSRPQRETIERVMHEWKEGDLETSRGTPVKSQRQAVAIALHEAGASRSESPVGNRRNVRRTKAQEAKGRRAAGGETRAELYEKARRQGIAGRSRMTKEELARALRRH